MTPKQTALARTGSLILISLAAGVLANLIFTTFSAGQILFVGVAGLGLFMVRMVYKVELDKAERLERLNKKVDTAQ